jgi:monofunctional glycosyltransferase
MKHGKRGPINWLFRMIVRLLVMVVVLIAAIFGGCEWYFTKLHPMAPRLSLQVATIVKERGIHELSYDQIPAFYRHAVIATEDRRFTSDPGIDLVGIARSIFTDIQRDGYVEGGSTITQQLVDNTLLSQQKSLQRKVLQALYAIGVYDSVPKHQVFADYANVIYFGNHAYGLYQASETYFGRPPQHLNEGELAMLAGLPNAPSAYNPIHHYQLAKQRQGDVIQNMVDAGYLTKQQGQAVATEPIRLSP